MVLGCFTRTIKVRNDLSFGESIVVELHYGRKLFCREALPVLLVLKPLTISCPILKAYQRISENKIHMLYFLQETSIVILFIGGLLVTQMQRVTKLMN